MEGVQRQTDGIINGTWGSPRGGQAMDQGSTILPGCGVGPGVPFAGGSSGSDWGTAGQGEARLSLFEPTSICWLKGWIVMVALSRP